MKFWILLWTRTKNGDIDNSEDHAVVYTDEAQARKEQVRLNAKPGHEAHVIKGQDQSNIGEVRGEVRGDLRAALSGLLWQVNQMKGMSGDEDQTIAEAIADAEDALEASRNK